MTDCANATCLIEGDLPPRRKERLEPGGTVIVLPEAGSPREFPPAEDGIVLHSNWPFMASPRMAQREAVIVLPEAGSPGEFPPAEDGIVLHSNWPFIGISSHGAKRDRFDRL